MWSTVIFIVSLTFAYGQHTPLFQDMVTQLGWHYSAAMGLQMNPNGAMSALQIGRGNTSLRLQHLYFGLPSKNDRWTWGLQLNLSQFSIQKSQAINLGWAYRIPLDSGTQLYLGSRVHLTNDYFYFNELKHITWPDPELLSEDAFWAYMDMSFLFQRGTLFLLYSYNRWGSHGRMEQTYTVHSPDQTILLGDEFLKRSKGTLSMIAAITKEKQTVRYFTSVFVETIHGTRMVFNVAFPFQ